MSDFAAYAWLPRATSADLRTKLSQLGLDALAEPRAAPPLNGLVAEFGLRSFETVRDLALWALDHRGENTAPTGGGVRRGRWPLTNPQGPDALAQSSRPVFSQRFPDSTT